MSRISKLVVASNNPNYKPGQLVQGAMGWQDYVQNEGFTEFGPFFPTPPGLTPEQVMGAYGANSITAWFGTATLPARGQLSATFCWQVAAPPTTFSYEIGGTDGNGNAVATTLQVPIGDPFDRKSGRPEITQ